MKRTVVVFALVLTASAQMPIPPTPQVSDAVKVRFFKASSEYQQAQSAAQMAERLAQDKKAVLQASIDELAKVCGKGFQPNLDKDGMPECKVVEKPSEKK